MITLKVDKLNREISQKLYDEIIESVDIHLLECTCKRHNMVVHGYYSRNIKTHNGNVELVILRVRCKECGKTHAVLISFIVPYQSIEMSVRIEIITDKDIEKIMNDNPSIDELNVYRVKERFRSKYKAWMRSLNLTLEDDLVLESFRYFRSNFMQTHRGVYNLNVIST